MSSEAEPAGLERHLSAPANEAFSAALAAIRRTPSLEVIAVDQALGAIELRERPGRLRRDRHHRVIVAPDDATTHLRMETMPEAAPSRSRRRPSRQTPSQPDPTHQTLLDDLVDLLQQTSFTYKQTTGQDD